MTGDFSATANCRGFVPEDNFADPDVIAETAADPDSRIGIMIAGNPYPVAP